METIKELIIKRLREELTPAEEQQLQSWVARSVHNRAVFEEINDWNSLAESFTKLDNLRTEETWEKITKFSEEKVPGDNVSNTVTKVPTREDATPIPPVHRIHFLKTAWFKYAAAILLLITGIATYYFIRTSKSQMEMVQTTPSPSKILPGSDVAVLTLSDGRKVELSATSETIKDGNLSIENVNGQLRYGAAAGTSVAYNTMTTPKGGQYELILPDGSQVWLNAASSLKYPTSFNEKNRQVELTGEAYFEIRENKSRPFIVNVVSGTLSPAGRGELSEAKVQREARGEGGFLPAGRQGAEARTAGYTITVLGTSFNVNSYPDEPILATTLITGSVKVKSGTQSVIIKPNQQATLKPNTEKLNITTPNMEEVLAWREGRYQFENTTIEAIMRQINRWYDVEIIYEGKRPTAQFNGILLRKESPVRLLNALTLTEQVHFDIKGKTIKVINGPKPKQ